MYYSHAGPRSRREFLTLKDRYAGPDKSIRLHEVWRVQALPQKRLLIASRLFHFAVCEQCYTPALRPQGDLIDSAETSTILCDAVYQECSPTYRERAESL